MLPVNKPEIFFYYLLIQKGIYGKRCICWHTGRNHMHTHTCTLLSSKSDSVVAMPTGLNRAFSCSMMASDATLAITTPQPPPTRHTHNNTHTYTHRARVLPFSNSSPTIWHTPYLHHFSVKNVYVCVCVCVCEGTFFMFVFVVFTPSVSYQGWPTFLSDGSVPPSLFFPSPAPHTDKVANHTAAFVCVCVCGVTKSIKICRGWGWK